MTTVSGSFSATGNSSLLSIRKDEAVDYSVTGSATATVVLEVDRSGGGSWETIETLDVSSDVSGTYSHVGEEARVRMRCSAYTSGTAVYSFNDQDQLGRNTIIAPSGVTVLQPKDSGVDLTGLIVGGNAAPHTIDISLAASTTTDGMEATITVKDALGVAIPAIHALEVWISESAVGAGLTGDATATVTVPTVGTLLDELTDDKHFTVLTAATGIATVLVVDSNNPADQYVCVKHPVTGRVTVSAASGTNWEGA